MEIGEYKGIIKETAIYPTKVDNFGLAYCWLGLIGESEEAMLAEGEDKIGEIGDVVWYSTAIANEMNLNLENILHSTIDVNDYYPNLNEYSEKIKKYYRDNTPIDVEELENVLAYNLKNVFAFCMVEEDTLDEIMEKNYTKLIKRRETNKLHGDGNHREKDIPSNTI